MITLKDVTEDNFRECVKLETTEKQKAYVAANVYSLAQAWLYPETARPFAIYADEIMVGFAMLDLDHDHDGSKKICDLWRFMIGKEQQGKGYGKAALGALIEWVKQTASYEKLRLSYVPGNAVAEKLYADFGFVATGEIDYDEIVMVLNLRD